MKRSSHQRRPASDPRGHLGQLAAGWSFAHERGIAVLRSDALARQKWLIHGFTMRPGGVSRLGGEGVLNLGATDWDTKQNVAANRELLRAALRAAQMPIVELQQCHSDMVHIVNAPPERALRGDALITRSASLLLAVKTADCVAVLLADTQQRAVAAVHAGWRGTLARIVQKTLGRMRMDFATDPGDVVALLGPAIGRCCYEVGPEVARAFAAQFDAAREWFDGPFEKVINNDSPNPLKWLQMTPPGHDPPPPRVDLDLHAANRWQILQAGVPARNVLASDLCTACRTDLLFSHRRERGKTGRMMGVIGIRGPEEIEA